MSGIGEWWWRRGRKKPSFLQNCSSRGCCETLSSYLHTVWKQHENATLPEIASQKAEPELHRASSELQLALCVVVVMRPESDVSVMHTIRMFPLHKRDCTQEKAPQSHWKIQRWINHALGMFCGWWLAGSSKSDGIMISAKTVQLKASDSRFRLGRR